MKTGMALRHQTTQKLKLLVFHYAVFLVYAAEREYSAGLCGVNVAMWLIDTSLLVIAVMDTGAFLYDIDVL